MRAPVWIYICAVILIASGIILPESLAAMQSSYSSVGHYLSELGAVGAPYAALINLFGFLPVVVTSVILLLFIVARRLSDRRGRIGAVLVMFGLSAGYGIAVMFPCDLGCPIEGSARQAVHNLAGLVQYPMGAVGLILMGVSLRRSHQSLGWLCLFSGVAMGVGFVMMMAPDQAGYRGLWQRLGDYSAFISVIVTAIFARRADTETGPTVLS